MPLYDVLTTIRDFKEEIRTAAAAATFCGVFLAALTIWVNTQRARKELAVKLINDWASDYALEMKQAFDLAAELDHAKIAEIVDGKTEFVEIAGTTNVSSIQRILKGSDPLFSSIPKNSTSDKIILNRVQCRILDYQWTSTLNRIEAIFTALDSKAANRRIMNIAFMPLIDSRRDTLNKLIAPPNDYFPMIREVLHKYGSQRRM
jgi:hypothetical protein